MLAAVMTSHINALKKTSVGFFKVNHDSVCLKATLPFSSGWVSLLLSRLRLALADDLVQQQEKLSVLKKTFIVQVDKLKGNVENFFFT